MRGRLLLVDGHALAYRAFYAIRELTTRAGQPTNAVFGFIRMLDQMFGTWRPSHVWVVFDGGLPEERMRLLDAYKAQRKEMPEALRGQFNDILEFLELSGICALTVEAQEADDVIATLAEQASREGVEVLIATSDKDLYQIVSTEVSIIALTKSGERLTEEAVEKRAGVPPRRIAEWLALTGDSADNIPGIPGVGPKTAARWLNQFGSLDALYDQVERVTPDKMKNALIHSREIVFRNLAMTKLRCDLPLPVQWAEGRIKSPDQSGLRGFYQRMEFHSMARALESPELFE